MALAKFNREYKESKKVKNVVICMYPNGIKNSHGSHLNHSLECFQKKLLAQREENVEIQVAFVYGDGIVYARDFKKLEEGSILYLESCKESPKLTHVWFLGMALLEKKAMEDRREGIISQNEFYLFTDQQFKRSDEQQILDCPRFQNQEIGITLVKSEGAAGGELERHISERGEIWMDTDF